jgi:hypothetical protein
LYRHNGPNEPTKEGMYSLNLHLLSRQGPPLSSLSDKSQKLKQKQSQDILLPHILTGNLKKKTFFYDNRTYEVMHLKSTDLEIKKQKKLQKFSFKTYTIENLNKNCFL